MRIKKHPPAGHVRSHAPADGEEYLYGNIGSACLMGLKADFPSKIREILRVCIESDADLLASNLGCL